MPNFVGAVIATRSLLFKNCGTQASTAHSSIFLSGKETCRLLIPKQV